MSDTYAEATKVKWFDTSVIEAMTVEEIQYLNHYDERVEDKNPYNNPWQDENIKMYALTYKRQANDFKRMAENLEPKSAIETKVDLNYEDMAEANWLRYLELKDSI